MALLALGVRAQRLRLGAARRRRVALALTLRPRSTALGTAFALTFVVLAVILYADRDVAPVLGHLSPDAGVARR